MRLVDADALKKEIHSYALDAFCINLENSKEFAGYSITENYCEGLYEATELIDYAPTIDAVEVVRCKDCKNMLVSDKWFRFCNVWCNINGMGDDGYCNYGERRKDEP